MRSHKLLYKTITPISLTTQSEKSEFCLMTSEPGTPVSPVVRVYPEEWKKPIPISGFKESLGERDIVLEYRLLRYLTETPEMAAQLQKWDANRDRYRDIRPFSNNIASVPNGDPTFYMNGSFVASPSNPRAFIGCQAPLPQTMDDFFRLLISWEVKGVICLAGHTETEMSFPKCHKYWPSSVGGVLVFGSTTVELVAMEEKGSLIVRRTLRVTRRVEDGKIPSAHLIEHVQFLGWPDHGAPEVEDTLPLHAEFERLRNLSPLIPVTVHCSAGVGRTGCFIALANAIDQGRTDGEVSVLSTVLELRKQRPFMCQTTGQYELVYKAVSAKFSDM